MAGKEIFPHEMTQAEWIAKGGGARSTGKTYPSEISAEIAWRKVKSRTRGEPIEWKIVTGPNHDPHRHPEYLVRGYSTDVEELIQQHREWIEAAFENNIEVSEEVLKDYPDLQNPPDTTAADGGEKMEIGLPEDGMRVVDPFSDRAGVVERSFSEDWEKNLRRSGGAVIVRWDDSPHRTSGEIWGVDVLPAMQSEAAAHEGNYLVLEETPDGNLRMTLTPAGREEVEERIDEIETDHLLYDLLEWHLGNGWDWLAPEDIGALTDAPILAWDVDRDDEGSVVLESVVKVYWFADYMVQGPVSAAYEKGESIWQGVRAGEGTGMYDRDYEGEG